MKTASRFLSTPVVVSPDTPVRELADKLLDSRAEGAVVTADGRVVGVATMMDLVRKETSLHLPASFILLDAVIPLPGERARAKRELERISAATVGEMMTSPAITVPPDASLEACANEMFNHHLSVLPVVDADGMLLGAVTKDGLVRAAGLTSDEDPELKT